MKGTAWLTIGADGSWNLVGWSAAIDGDHSDGESADGSVEGLDASVYRLHRVAFELPPAPVEVGEDVSAEVSGIATEAESALEQRLMLDGEEP